MATDDIPDAAARRLALALVENCLRNSKLEDLHAGTTPGTAVGDFSDVKVVTPFGDIPWNQLSRITDEEMKALMIEVVNKVYTFIIHMEDLVSLRDSARWKRPEHDAALLQIALQRATERNGEEAGERP
ncbi:hypothetical protein SAMN05518801_12037 [Novosphingobium sp. CF614]|uniref:hypothetical protein n=1 Tax=Novosphingobium sp. CF614 TaxID=1884364 RepID=UPI0008E6FF3D|nr:hypothetical protein [Novosphingobium sp. CF614]SFG37261.1 hypothetical protein SAMN05518801_12037 [Novosphingobium sp. CF614]